MLECHYHVDFIAGHWINHGKEHCIVGVKGNPQCNRGFDCDIIVAEVTPPTLILTTRKMYRFLHIKRCEPRFSTHYWFRGNYWTKLIQIWYGDSI